MTNASFRRRQQLLLIILVLNVLPPVVSLSCSLQKWSQQTCPAAGSRLLARSTFDADDDGSLRHDGSPLHWNRRQAMEALGLSTITLSAATLPASANTLQTYDLGCLLDLPDIADDCVRIYLCRHGQTENNRLGKVQGARVDPDINYNGIQQALRLGAAFSKLDEACPSHMYHSNLIRAQETAEYAARNIAEDIDDKVVILDGLSILGEVDFGSVAEGKPLTDARGGMLQTYGAWAAGFVDARGEGGGESGREVMNRCTSALTYLVKEAEKNGGSVIAVSHSKFLKVLLSIMDDVPLIQGATTQQTNCCIDVLDMKRDGSFVTLGPKCNLIGGAMSNAPQDFSLRVPAGRVVRVNEKRHLVDLEMG